MAFYSKTLSKSEQRHSAVEKEAQAIIEAVRKWRHFLTGHHFKLITDQRSVAVMFDRRATGKVKNEKTMRWRVELSSYSFDIIYRPGTENSAADALSRMYSCSLQKPNSLYTLHQDLGHPGITRFTHFIKSRNLPYSIEEIKRMITGCRVCAELKPRFAQVLSSTLIKATRPIRTSFDGLQGTSTISLQQEILTQNC